MWSVRLANAKQFAASSARSLLDEARAAGLALEHSCRTGRCGACKVRVASGRTQLLEAESSLTTQESEAGLVLSCCRSAASDLELDTEDLGALGSLPLKTLPARIDSLVRLAPDVMQVLLRLAPGSGLEYLPGQYIDVIGHGGVHRSYSIANAPRADGKLELHVRQVEGGVMSRYWFTEARPNDLLRIHGPLGTFSLREDRKQRLVFLATGTGIAPVKAMLEAIPQGAADEQIHVYWGGRTPADHYIEPVASGRAIRYVRVLSRTRAASARTGHVQQVLLDDLLPLEDSTVYACGSEAMIRSAKAQLTARGLSPRHFHSDAFVSSNEGTKT
jgi:CDP-4-dehydro-6-deoxyglucose reductase